MDKFGFAKQVIYEAGAFIKEAMTYELEIDTKSARNDFVTNVDKETEALIVNRIKEKFDQQDFITEEKIVETQGYDDLWIIDPIDGTSNFIYEKRNYTISIAYYEKKKPVFGLVYDVSRDELYSSVKGKGAWLNDVSLPMLKDDTHMMDSVVYASSKSLAKLFGDPLISYQKFMSIRYMGSATLEIVGIAAGRHHSYISRRLKVWDIAAAVIILNEVGGHFTFDRKLDTVLFEDMNYEFVSASCMTLLDEINQER